MNTSMVTKPPVLYPYCPNMREFCVPIHTHHYFTNTAFCLSYTLTHYYYYYIYVVFSLKHAPAIHLHNKQICHNLYKTYPGYIAFYDNMSGWGSTSLDIPYGWGTKDTKWNN